MEKKLYRNEHDRAIAGVASGLADYLQIDVTIARILFVLATIFLGGSGAIAYIILWIVAPVNNDPTLKFKKFNEYFNQGPLGGSVFNNPETFNNPYTQTQQTKWSAETAAKPYGQELKPKSAHTGRTIIGLILLFLGVYFLLREQDLLPYWFNIFHIYKLWPLALVALGVSLIFKNKNKSEWDEFRKATAEKENETSTTTPENQTNNNPTNNF